MKSFIKKLIAQFLPEVKPRVSKSVLIVKPRPISFQERYSQIANDLKISALFDRFNSELKMALKQQEPRQTIFMEHGRFADGRKFTYYKPINQKGFILEVTDHGWSISRAEKIPTQGLFLKNTTDFWDNIQLLDAADTTVVRVSSKKSKNELPVFSVYSEQAIADLIATMNTKI